MPTWSSPRWPPGVPHDICGFEKPLHGILDDAASEVPRLPYTIFQGARRSFGAVKDMADRVAAFLVSRGLKKGDRAAIFLPNIPHYPPVFFGILKAGGVCVTCNPLYKADELRFQLQDSGAKAVFVMDHPDFYPTACQAIRDTAVETLVICNVRSFLPPLKALLGGILGRIPHAARHDPSHFLFDDVIERTPPIPRNVEIEPTVDLALIIYTGGTTGVPKGAALTHANFMANIEAGRLWVSIPHSPGSEPEPLRKGGFHCLLGVLPWYHSFGLTLCMLMAPAIQASMVCIPDPRAGRPPFTDVLRAVERYRTTLVTGVPTIFVAFAHHPMADRYDLSSIMACGSGGAPLPEAVAHRFEERTGAILFEGYGLSETSPVLCLNPTHRDLRKFGSVGLPIPGTLIRILDRETGTRELPQGEDGEIAACGPQVMRGYWGRPEEDALVFRQLDNLRWFLTGDIGHIDEDGFIVITDRKKDLVLVGGFNVYPREVEDILFTHPKVALAAVVGVPDPHSGERVKAFVQLRPGETCTEAEILAFCKDRMAGYKRPREVEIRDSLPTSPIGKVLRRVLRDEERARLGR